MDDRSKRKPVLVLADHDTDVICGEGVALVEDERGLRPATDQELRELEQAAPYRP